MKLEFVEVCGFRGFREKVRVNFGSGFTVITGRNGVGKSTLCDAVEFALTGSIDKYAVEKAAQESLDDYLWWRGQGKPSDHYVTASFKRDDGETFAITRTRKSGADKTTAQIEAAFCHSTRPDDAIRQLCRTSIMLDRVNRAIVASGVAARAIVGRIQSLHESSPPTLKFRSMPILGK